MQIKLKYRKYHKIMLFEAPIHHAFTNTNKITNLQVSFPSKRYLVILSLLRGCSQYRNKY